MKNPSRLLGALALTTLFLFSLKGRDGAQEPASHGQASAAQRTVILVRHAEKDTDDPRDPRLSPAGELRAERLADLLAKSGVERLLASEYIRTQATLAPLAEALGLEVEVLPARDLAGLAKAIEEAPPGTTLVVAGHSNTIPALAARLGTSLPGLLDSGHGANIDESQYDRLFAVTLPPEGSGALPALLELRF